MTQLPVGCRLCSSNWQNGMEGVVNAATWQVLGQIAGIGGIALGVFLVLFRDIIRRNIFPKLTKQDGYRLMRLITLCVWSVAVLGVAVWGALEFRSGTKVDQSTTGVGSPAISGVGGDVTVTVSEP